MGLNTDALLDLNTFALTDHELKRYDIEEGPFCVYAKYVTWINTLCRLDVRIDRWDDATCRRILIEASLRRGFNSDLTLVVEERVSKSKTGRGKRARFLHMEYTNELIFSIEYVEYKEGGRRQHSHLLNGMYGQWKSGIRSRDPKLRAPAVLDETEIRGIETEIEKSLDGLKIGLMSLRQRYKEF